MSDESYKWAPTYPDFILAYLWDNWEGLKNTVWVLDLAYFRRDAE